MIRRTPRLYPSIALALALLFAQAGALAHATSHLLSKQNTGHLHATLCGHCLSYSPLFAMAGGSGAASAPVLAKVVLAGTAFISLIERTVPRVFRSRAPPRPR